MSIIKDLQADQMHRKLITESSYNAHQKNFWKHGDAEEHLNSFKGPDHKKLRSMHGDAAAAHHDAMWAHDEHGKNSEKFKQASAHAKELTKKVNAAHKELSKKGLTTTKAGPIHDDDKSPTDHHFEKLSYHGDAAEKHRKLFRKTGNKLHKEIAIKHENAAAAHDFAEMHASHHSSDHPTYKKAASEAETLSKKADDFHMSVNKKLN